MKVKDLRKLPKRDWDKPFEYDSILIVPSGKKHKSGYALIYIVGVMVHTPIEIAAECDDICWIIPNDIRPQQVRTEMMYPSGIVHFWSDYYRYKVGNSLSSTNVYLVKKS